MICFLVLWFDAQFLRITFIPCEKLESLVLLGVQKSLVVEKFNVRKAFSPQMIQLLVLSSTYTLHLSCFACDCFMIDDCGNG